MGEEDPNGSLMDTWLDSPYIYDSYDTNDGDGGSYALLYLVLGENRL